MSLLVSSFVLGWCSISRTNTWVGNETRTQYPSTYVETFQVSYHSLFEIPVIYQIKKSNRVNKDKFVSAGHIWYQWNFFPGNKDSSHLF